MTYLRPLTVTAIIGLAAMGGKASSDGSEYYNWHQHVPTAQPGLNKDTQFHSGVYYGPTTLGGTFHSPITVYGPFQGNGITLSSLYVAGPATLTDATIAQNIQVDGPTTLDTTKVKGDAAINGPLKTHASTIGGILKMAGPLSASKSTFSTISIASTELTFKECALLQALVIEKNGHQPTHVFLDHTTIAGTITCHQPTTLIVRNPSTWTHKTKGACTLKQM